MGKRRPKNYKKKLPAHLRIPPEYGTLTKTICAIYDLIYSFGLGGCWMSNRTIARKIPCSKRTVQRARKALFQKEIIIKAWTNPHTVIMWARFHKAVENCQVLFYPIRQKMDNPYYLLSPQRERVTNQPFRGDKMSPKLDVKTLKGFLLPFKVKESTKSMSMAYSSRDPVPNPASPAGLTGARLPEKPIEEDFDPNQDIFALRNPEIRANFKFAFLDCYDNLRDNNYNHERALRMTNTIILEKQNKSDKERFGD